MHQPALHYTEQLYTSQVHYNLFDTSTSKAMSPAPPQVWVLWNGGGVLYPQLQVCPAVVSNEPMLGIQLASATWLTS